MRRVLLAVPLLLLPACSETPSGPPTNVQPQLSTAVGTTAKWSFHATIYYVMEGNAFAVGDELNGSVQFAVTGSGFYPQACWFQYPASSTFTYTINGQTYTQAADGAANVIRACWPYTLQPLVQFNFGGSSQSWVLEMWLPVDGENLPLTPPPISDHSVLNVLNHDVQTNFFATLTSVRPEPLSKQACKADGWKAFGFRNQGLCVSYMETGKDTR